MVRHKVEMRQPLVYLEGTAGCVAVRSAAIPRLRSFRVRRRRRRLMTESVPRHLAPLYCRLAALRSRNTEPREELKRIE